MATGKMKKWMGGQIRTGVTQITLRHEEVQYKRDILFSMAFILALEPTQPPIRCLAWAHPPRPTGE